MSYPDPPPPPSFTFFAYGGGEFLPPTQPFKRQRSLENNELNPAPFPPMNPRVNLPTLQGKGTRHMFYKTRVCLKYLEGNCRNGEHCTFAHGAEDLREPPPNWQDLVREKDRGSGSWKDDMNQRVKICNKFYIGEECPYGENCNYVHERPPNFKSDMAKDQRESLAITIGTTDSDELSFWKTRLCRKYEITGQCPFGEKCNYAHGQSELKAFSGESETEGDSTNFPPGPVPINPLANAEGDSVRADQVVAGLPGKVEQEEKKFRLWKPNKKISGIYGDWIDGLNPPHLLSSEKDDI